MIAETSVAPLTRTTRSGNVLERPARIQAEIAAALALSPGEILRRAAADPATEESMSEECMVHLIRHDLRARRKHLAEDLTPFLLERCERRLRGSVRGFPPSAAAEIREEVLGRLAMSLAGAGNEADFLEVRFALALKRLRIDVCRRERRRLQGLVALEEVPAGSGDDLDAQVIDRAPPSPPNQEDRLLIQQALSTLTAEERKVLVLHKLAGVPLSSSKSPAKRTDETAPRKGDKASTAGATLVGLLGRSERTLRNRLRSAEAKLGNLHDSAPLVPLRDSTPLVPLRDSAPLVPLRGNPNRKDRK